MKLSTEEVRRLRTERGWSQEHLAQAAGLSVRTVQRVESEGTASLATATCLAATFEVRLQALQDGPAPQRTAGPNLHAGWLHAGLAVLTLAALRFAFDSAAGIGGGPFTAVDIIIALAGLGLVALPLRQAVRERQFSGLALAVFGTPLVTFLAVGMAFAVASQRLPTGATVVIGMSGLALVGMSSRHLRTPPRQSANGRRPSPIQ